MSKSAIDLVRGTPAHREHVTNEPEESCYELLDELVSHQLILASSKDIESCSRINDGNVGMNVNNNVYTPALITSCEKVISHRYEDHLSLMTEIQLRRTVDRLSLTESGEEQATDGDEVMVKDGHTTSKFSKGAICGKSSGHTAPPCAALWARCGALDYMAGRLL